MTYYERYKMDFTKIQLNNHNHNKVSLIQTAKSGQTEYINNILKSKYTRDKYTSYAAGQAILGWPSCHI